MIDLTYLKTTTDNDKTLIEELLRIFVLQLPSLKNNIVTAFDSKDWNQLKETAHKAKNSFEIIGAKKEADELKQVEKIAGSDMDKTQLNLLINNFLDSCEIVLDEIENLKI